MRNDSHWMSATAITISNVLRVQSRTRVSRRSRHKPGLATNGIYSVNLVSPLQLHRLRTPNAIDIAIASTGPSFFPSFPSFLSLSFSFYSSTSSSSSTISPPSYVFTIPSETLYVSACRVVTWLLCMDFRGAFLPSLFTRTHTPITIARTGPAKYFSAASRTTAHVLFSVRCRCLVQAHFIRVHTRNVTIGLLFMLVVSHDQWRSTC